MSELFSTRNLIIAYFVIGSVVCLVHPQLLRSLFVDLRNVDIGAAAFLLRPLVALLVFLLYCGLWPVAWFNAGNSQRKAKEAVRAEIERMHALRDRQRKHRF